MRSPEGNQVGDTSSALSSVSFSMPPLLNSSRYKSVRPASVPRKPLKPDVALILVLTVFAALLGTLVTGATRDWLSGRLVEPWQVERSLGLPVLSQVKLS